MPRIVVYHVIGLAVALAVGLTAAGAGLTEWLIVLGALVVVGVGIWAKSIAEWCFISSFQLPEVEEEWERKRLLEESEKHRKATLGQRLEVDGKESA